MRKIIKTATSLLLGIVIFWCSGSYAEMSIRSVEQDEMDKVQIGDSSEKVREMLGKPHRVFSEEEMEKLLPGKREYKYKIGKKEAWFYANAGQSPKIIFNTENLESKVDIDGNQDIVYSPGNMTEEQKKKEGIYDITIDQVVGMQKSIQKSKGAEPDPDYLIVFVKDKVVEKAQRRYK